MESSFVEWVYLKTIVGNFEGLIQYYFSSMAYLAPWIRQASVSILYSLGLAWAALCMFKAPVDRLYSALGVFATVALAGFLVSPTTNTENLGSASGTELSVGAYYSFFLAGSMTEAFQSVVTASWKNSISAANGGGGPSKDAIALAFADKSAQFADKFLKGEGKEAVKDYYQKCGPEAYKQATTPAQKSMLRSVGIGANTLGMANNEATEVAQRAKKDANRNPDYSNAWTDGNDINAGFAQYDQFVDQAKQVDANRSEAEKFLSNLPVANSSIDGTKGYRIPTTNYYKAALSSDANANNSKVDSFKKVSTSNGALSNMLAKGATSTTPGDETDYMFYPKNCYDLYKVASETMSSLREGSRGVAGYENLPMTGQFSSMSASATVRRAINDEISRQFKDMGIDKNVDASFMETLSDYTYDATTKLSNTYDKWMLEYGIPSTISVMAMIVAILLITFPIFALVSVMFGAKVLASYFKLMAFPFIVVFINNLLLSLSANLIAFNKAYAIVPESFNPGSVDTASALSGMSAETIIFASICVCEVAIAKFILWDDVRAVTGFSPAAASQNAVSRGASLIGSAISMATGALGKTASLAKGAQSAQAAKGMSTAVANISKQVTQIASGASRGQNRSPVSFSGNSSGNASGSGSSSSSAAGGVGGTSGGSSSSSSKPVGAGKSLNPPEPPPETKA